MKFTCYLLFILIMYYKLSEVFSDKPSCQYSLTKIIGVSESEKVEIVCRVDAEPPAQNFIWKLNNSKTTVNFKSSTFTSNGTTSVLQYTPKTDSDFGVFSCWARNSKGLQKKPCTFHLVLASKPESVRNCSRSHRTKSSVEILCFPGFDGGLHQVFTLEVFTSFSVPPIYNITTTGVPNFHLVNLKPDVSYKVLVTATNAKGSSAPVTMPEFTLQDIRVRQKRESKNLRRSKAGRLKFYEKNYLRNQIHLRLPKKTEIKSKARETTTKPQTTEKDNEAWLYSNKSAKNRILKTRRSAAQIAEEKCRQYKEARFTYRQIVSPIFEEENITEKILNCHNVQPLIVNGEHAEPKEFPHMALIGYGQRAKDAEWLCGGTLISERYVLSAAHCNYGKKGRPKWAKLGELDLGNSTEDARPIDYTISDIHEHPLYKNPKQYNDITLYKLHANVELSPYMRPICLYIKDTDTNPSTEEKAYITGWGFTSESEPASEHLLKSSVWFLDNEECEERYAFSSKFPNGYDSSVAVCAGDLISGNDTCQGDSGGPLQITFSDESCMYHQVGITSVGSRTCGDGTPSVYTRVSHYIEWIQNIVWPDEHT